MTESPTPHVPPHRPSIIVPSSAKPTASAVASAHSAFPAILWRPIGAVVAALIGAAFFFVIVGVFGLFAAAAGLAVFVAISLLISCRSQETR
jgi:hypothetical protein